VPRQVFGLMRDRHAKKNDEKTSGCCVENQGFASALAITVWVRKKA
jgi:hypothetical protein